MKLTYFAHEEWERDYISGKLPDIELDFRVGAFQVSAGGNAEIISIFVDSHFDAQAFDAFPNLKLLATRSTGFDHIDLEEAKKRNVKVVNVPTYGANTVAEYTFALLLALSRKVCEAQAQVREHNSFSQDGFVGFDLQGKTIGVVGCGSIGKHVIQIAHGFGMNVLVYDTLCETSLSSTLNFTHVTLEELLAQSDIITLHVPLTEKTQHLINSKNISLIKKGAYILNTARGGIIETDALVQALKDGTVAGAGLDVLEEEGEMKDELLLLSSPHPKEEELRTVLENHYLMDHPRVIVTPHIAFDTTEAIQRILDTSIENIVAFQKGEIDNQVTN